METKKIVLLEDGTSFLYRGKEIHTHLGTIKKEKLSKFGEIKLEKGRGFVLPLLSSDALTKIKRKSNIIYPKDIGAILLYSGINKESVVIEAGLGSGYFALMLSFFVKKIYSYEIREDMIKVAKKNFELFDVNNVVIKKKDITKGIDEKGDLIVLDLREPWKVLKHAYKALKIGHYVVTYTPQITQIMKCLEKLPNGFKHEKTIEMLEREWSFQGKNIARPKHLMHAHTGFLSFFRKVK